MSDPTKALIFTKTTDYRHDSIPNGIATFLQLCKDYSPPIDAIATEDDTVLNGFLKSIELEEKSLVIFLLTSGDVLSESTRELLKSYVEGGGGFMGVHSATFTEPSWSWYKDGLLGARFTNHPPFCAGDVHLTNHGVEHASFDFHIELPTVRSGNGKETKKWNIQDEWYNFDTRPEGHETKVLATVDEQSYEGGEMGENHPIIWTREVGKGRVFHTSIGHAVEAYDDTIFRRHLLGGLKWTIGQS